MRRFLPGLHTGHHASSTNLDGVFLVSVQQAAYQWHTHKPFLSLCFSILEPVDFEAISFTGRLYCTDRALWKLTWFLRDFGYDGDLLSRDQIDDKALRNLRGVIRTSFTQLNGHSYQNLDSFAPASEWEALSRTGDFAENASHPHDL